MTLLVIIASVVSATACLAIGFRAARSDAPPRRSPGVIALPAAVVFVALAGATALLDDKVGEPSAHEDPSPGLIEGSASDIDRRDLAGFREDATVHAGAVEKPLCLMSFFNSNPGAERSSRWWTSCGYGKRLKTIAEVRERLALPAEWGKRDARVIARVPAGAQIAYLRGVAAAQCEMNEPRCYHGGGVQYRVIGLEGRWLGEKQCLKTRGEHRRLHYGPCP